MGASCDPELVTANLGHFDLHGRTALITGAAGLLGPEHAAALLECGARVVLTDVNTERLQGVSLKLAQEFGDRVVMRRMDVTEPESVAATARELAATGGAGILVNNAAIDPKVDANRSAAMEESRLENFPIERWNLEIAVGLTGALVCSQIFGAQMTRSGGGVILNIASDLSVMAPDQRLYRREGLPEDQQPVKPVTYSVIKSGLVGLTRYLAGYWAAQGVRANALSPGGVYSNQPEEFVRRLVDLIPLGRMAARDEYRAAVQFLCSSTLR